MDEKTKTQIRIVESWPKRLGKRYLLKHLRGGMLYRSEAVKAKCYECCGGEGGPCTVRICPLYQYSQYVESGKQLELESDA